MKIFALPLALLLASAPVVAATSSPAFAQDMSRGADNFYKSPQLDVEKVRFRNKFGMEVIGNLFVPKGFDRSTKASAIVVGHPMGATKEQSANLYAQKLAEQGFVTLSFDLSYWGESEGSPRNTVAPEIYVDDFSAAVDFLSGQRFVNAENIGVLGICGSGSFALSAASIDPRMKAVATVSMYDMGAANRDGLRKSVTAEQRQAIIQEAAAQRQAEAGGAPVKYAGGTPFEITADSPAIAKEFYDFYRTPRGEFTPPGQDASVPTTQPTVASNAAFMNFYPFEKLSEISPRPVMFVAGSEAHSIEFSEDAYQRAAEPKQLVIVPGAGHVDLYDRTALIPFDKLTEFFRGNLT